MLAKYPKLIIAQKKQVINSIFQRIYISVSLHLTFYYDIANVSGGPH